VPLNESFQIDMPRVKALLPDKNIKIIFICSPNNPTGNVMNYSDVEYIIKNFKGIILLDEAYIDFSNKPSLIKLIDKYPNLILMQTFSKAFGLAAVRVGMAFADKSVIQYFNKLKPPYNISTINQAAALNKLKKAESVKKQIIIIKKEKERMVKVLSKLKIIEKVFPSDANFLLVKVKNSTSVYNTLVNKGIITRNRHSVVDNCLRITIGKRSENESLVKTIKTISI